MLEIKPMTSSDPFVHPVHPAKAADGHSAPSATTVVTAKASQEAQEWAAPVGIHHHSPAEALKQKIKELLFR